MGLPKKPESETKRTDRVAGHPTQDFPPDVPMSPSAVGFSMSTVGQGGNMKRSPGCGGATGVTSNAGRCAVVRCFKRPRPRVCPYDGTRHGHGAIHYDCGYPESSLKFRTGDWFWICDEHYLVCAAEREAWERTPVQQEG